MPISLFWRTLMAICSASLPEALIVGSARSASMRVKGSVVHPPAVPGPRRMPWWRSGAGVTGRGSSFRLR